MTHCNNKNIHKYFYLFVGPFNGIKKPICESKYNDIFITLFLTIHYIIVCKKKLPKIYKNLIFNKFIKKYNKIKYLKYKSLYESLNINEKNIFSYKIKNIYDENITFVTHHDIYAHVLLLLKKYLLISKKNININSIDIYIKYNNLNGFTGTPLINSMYVAKKDEMYKKYEISSINSNKLFINEKDDNIVNINNMYNIKYKIYFDNEKKITLENIHDFFNNVSKSINENTKNNELSFSCFIDVCGIMKNFSSLKVAKFLINNYDLKYVVFIDIDDTQKIIDKNELIINYDYKLLYESNVKFVVYFDNRHVIGTDLKNQLYNNNLMFNDNIVVYLGKQNDYNKYQQAIGRSRMYFLTSFCIFIDENIECKINFNDKYVIFDNECIKLIENTKNIKIKNNASNIIKLCMIYLFKYEKLSFDNIDKYLKDICNDTPMNNNFYDNYNYKIDTEKYHYIFIDKLINNVETILLNLFDKKYTFTYFLNNEFDENNTNIKYISDYLKNKYA